MHRKLAALALALAFSPLAGLAQQAQAPAGAAPAASEPEVIVVTAQRKEQDLQEVPISVTALQSADLEAMQVGNFSEIGYAVPNLSTNLQLGASTTPAYAIRGVTSGLLSFSVDSGVGLYLDGVYVARSAGSAFDLADIERVEVLRGPQGILWGRNTTAGAINFVTARPSEDFGVKQTLSGGNYGLFRSRTTLNTGELNGFSARLTYLHSQQDGYVDNLAAGRTFDFNTGGVRTSVKDFGRENNDAAMLALHYESERFRGDYKFDYTKLHSSQQATQAVGFSDGGGGGFAQLIFALQPTVGGEGVISRKRLANVANEMMTASELQVWGQSLTLELDLTEAITLRSITGYRDIEEFVGGNDIDGNELFNPDLAPILGFNLGPVGAPLPIITSAGKGRQQNQVQQELQILGEAGPIEWIAGLFYFQEDGTDQGNLWILTPFPGGVAPPATFTDQRVDNQSIAIYGNATWHVLDSLHLSFGARQTWDERLAVDPTYAPARQSGDFDNADWQLKLAWDALENVNLYYSVGTSFLSGGFLNGESFAEEQVLAHELGAKTSWLDQRVTFNAAVFFENYDDLQVPIFTGGALRVFNAGKAEIWGVELEGRAEPLEGLSLSYGFGHQDFDFLEFFPVLPGPNEADRAQRTNTPENTVNLALQYELPEFSWGRISARIDANWRDDVKFLLFPLTGDVAANAASTQQAHWQLGTRLGVSDIPLGDRLRLGVAFWTDNLLDEAEPGFSSDLGLVVVSKFQKPRTYGVDVTLEF
jgi:iron complex outermembrane receptor protein